MASKKKANQKPTKSVIISKSNSLYEKAIELYEKSGRTAQKWQVDLMKCILSRNKKDLWTHTKFGDYYYLEEIVKWVDIKAFD